MADDPIDPDIEYGDPKRVLRSIAQDALSGSPDLLEREGHIIRGALNHNLNRTSGPWRGAGALAGESIDAFARLPPAQQQLAIRTGFMNQGDRPQDRSSYSMRPAHIAPDRPEVTRAAWARNLANPERPAGIVPDITPTTSMAEAFRTRPAYNPEEIPFAPTRPPLLSDRLARQLLVSGSDVDTPTRFRALDDLLAAERRLQTLPANNDRYNAFAQFNRMRADVLNAFSFSNYDRQNTVGAIKRWLRDLGLPDDLPSEGAEAEPGWRAVIGPDLGNRAVAPPVAGLAGAATLPAWAAALGGAHIEAGRGMVDDASFTGVEGIPAWAQAVGSGGGGGITGQMTPTRD